MGLDPGTPGSRLGPKGDTQLLSHPGIPMAYCYNCSILLLVFYKAKYAGHYEEKIKNEHLVCIIKELTHFETKEVYTCELAFTVVKEKVLF